MRAVNRWENSFHKSPRPNGVPNLFLRPGFIDGSVRTIQSKWDDQRKNLIYVAVTWNPVSGAKQSGPIAIPKDFVYQCPLDKGRLLGIGPAAIWPPYVPTDRTGQSFNMGDPANRGPRHSNRLFKSPQQVYQWRRSES